MNVVRIKNERVFIIPYLKRIKGGIMKYLIFFLCILLISSCDIFDLDIKYEVTGTADTVNITYKNEDGGTSQANGVSSCLGPTHLKHNQVILSIFLPKIMENPEQ